MAKKEKTKLESVTIEGQSKSKAETVRAIKFALFSASAGIIETIVSTVLDLAVPGWDYYVCYAIALFCSVVWNFTFNRKFTFKSANNVPVAMAKVLLFYVFFAPYSIWLTAVLEKHIPNILCLAIMMAQNFILEYLWDRFVVFRNSLDTNDVAKKDAAKAHEKALEKAAAEGKVADAVVADAAEAEATVAEAAEAVAEAAAPAYEVGKTVSDVTADNVVSDDDAMKIIQEYVSKGK